MWTISNGDIGLITVKVTSVDRYCVQHGCCATRLTPQSLVASVVLEALVAFVALKPHVASDVLGTLGFPLVVLCTLIPVSHSGLGCPGDSQNPGNPASPKGYRPLGLVALRVLGLLATGAAILSRMIVPFYTKL